jgi:NADH dehydrogenase FAD-containing subunit
MMTLLCCGTTLPRYSASPLPRHNLTIAPLDCDAASGQASLPGLSDAQRIEQLTFVVIGAGPTGVECCGELRDFVAQDVPRLYPDLVPFVRIVLLSSSNKVLMAFDGDLQDAALEKLRSNNQGVAIDVRLGAGVRCEGVQWEVVP